MQFRFPPFFLFLSFSQSESVVFFLSFCTVCASQVAMDIIFAIDGSKSVGSSNFEEQLNWVANLITDALPTNARIGIIEFDTTSNILYELDNGLNKAQLAHNVLNIQYPAGQTNTRLSSLFFFSWFSRNKQKKHRGSRQRFPVSIRPLLIFGRL